MSINDAAQLFADWCHVVGETNPTELTLQVWLSYNAEDLIDTKTLVWHRFIRLRTTVRRHA